MNEQQVANMKLSLADYTSNELITLAVQLQQTIDTHVAEKTGQATAVSQMARQNEALIAENERLEAAAQNAVPSDEVNDLKSQVKDLTEQIGSLRKRNDKLQDALVGD